MLRVGPTTVCCWKRGILDIETDISEGNIFCKLRIA